MRRRHYLLFGTLAATLLLRLPGIGWGLPPATPHVVASDLRSSYSFDEDDILSGVAKAHVAQLDFDPHDYHWGTLHLELVLLALDGAEAVGVFGTPWRTAYYSLLGDDFVRVYVVARLVAVAAALLTVWLLFCYPGEWAGAFAAMLVAVSPTHLFQSDQVRVDITMTGLVVLTLFAGVRVQARPQAWQFFLLGTTAGLAIAAKYSAVPAVAAIALAALCLKRFPWRGVLAVAGGAMFGFLAGSPYFLLKPHAFYADLNRYVNAGVPASLLIPAGKLLELHALNLARFTMGVPAFLLALGGIVWMLRRRSPSDWLLLAGIVGSVVLLVPLRWPLLRQALPLFALLALSAGIALEQFSKRWHYCLTAVALIMPLAASLAQISYMTSAHPANQMLQRILEVVPPGSAIARLVREEPPLDVKVYPMGPNVFADDLSKNPPAWALTTDLPDPPYPPATVALLRASYDEVAHFESRRILAWATFGESGAPHDWKYTHNSFTLYRKKTP